MPLLSILAFLSALLVAIPALALLLLTLAALDRRADRRPSRSAAGLITGRIAVLVPAHNESHHVVPTIACLRDQLGMSDRLIVVADNCSDDTAEIARAAGAQVIERHDLQRRGKGYALAFGIDQLREDPPDVVVVVDADCTLTPGSLYQAAQQAERESRPVQMLNLMHAPAEAGVRTRILEFAWVVKNQVRPLGTTRLGDTCHLMGTGMAIPWHLLSDADLATGHITEDMKLGLDLAIAGHAPVLCPRAEVHSMFPLDANVARGQKARWEHGHLTTLRQELPRLIRAWLRRPAAATAALALDLLIPPLALYVLTLGAATLGASALAVVWGGAALAVSVLWLALAALLLAVGLAWWHHGRHLLSALELLTTPLYALWKLPVYLAYAIQRRSGWVRTQRDDGKPSI